MKIVAISDLHRKRPIIGYCDILIFAGDEDANSLANTKKFASWLEKQDAKYKIVVWGNHDWYPYNHSNMAKEVLKEYNIIYLENSGIEIEGIKFWGSPITPTFCEWAFMEDRGSRIRKYWDMIPENIDVLITHGPPYGILDYTVYDKIHVGCADLMQAVERVKPKFHIFGHIHEGYGDDKRFWYKDMKDTGHKTVFLNVAQVNEEYEHINKPVQFDI